MIPMIDHATRHAEAVVSGKILSGRLHFLACQRHLRDLERQGSPDFPFIWIPEKSQRIISFAEDLTIAEGMQKKPVRLFDNQCFDFGCRMGWVKQKNGSRRFRRSYVSKARQNGKSFDNGILGPYIAACSGYHQGSLFTAATKKRQAKIAWTEMMRFIQSDPDLDELFKIQEYKSLITCLATGCTIEALSKEGGLDDGFRSIFVSLDEIHQMKDDAVYQALYIGTRSLPETLVSMITTRGTNVSSSFCFKMDKYCQSILYGTETAEDFFVDIYTIDEEDDPFDESVWVKANPVLLHPDNPEVEEHFETFRADASAARAMGGDSLTSYMVKNLNLWYRKQDNEFVDHKKFAECASDLTFEDFRGAAVNIGIDLSSGGDLTSWMIEIPMSNGHYFIDGHSYMPRGRFEEHIKTDSAPYDVWEKAGLITVTGGSMDFKNDYGFLLADLREVISRYDFKINLILPDPRNLDGIIGELESFGAPIMPVTQSARSLDTATVDIQLLVKSLKYHYSRHNELLAHSFINAVTVKNSFGEIKVDKTSAGNRIDPVDAAVCAHYGSCGKDAKRELDIDEELEKYMEIMGKLWK